MKTRPRIGLNAQLLAGSASYRSAGIHRYMERLLHHLPAAAGDFDLVAFVNRQAQRMADGLRVRATGWPTHRPLARIVWEQAVQPVWARTEELDLLHSLAFVSPLIRPCRTVVTIYDLSFVRFPGLFRGAHAAYLRLFTRLACRAAERIIAISESTRRDVMSLYGAPGERVDVAPPGVDPVFRPLPGEQVEAFRRRRGLPEAFILHVGTLEPRKNHVRLLQALSQLSTHPQLAGLRLVCVGGPGWSCGEIYAAVERLNLQERVIWTGYAPAEELPLWYNAAMLFVYPSLYEGFGMPVLEAMACGTPVITSNVSSLPEAADEAGRLVSPDDVDGLADAMRRLLADPDLRQRLRAAGLAHAATFTWERTARQTAAAYGKALFMKDEG